MKGSRVKPLGIGQEIEVGLMGDNPRLDPIHRDGFPLAARKALHCRRCASAILARSAVVFGPVDSPILSFPLHSLRPHNARTRGRGGMYITCTWPVSFADCAAASIIYLPRPRNARMRTLPRFGEIVASLQEAMGITT
jgi:hypothetical protein